MASPCREPALCQLYRILSFPICMGRGGLFAYGTADATAISKPHRPLPYLNPDWFNVPFWLVPAFPGCPSGGR